MRQAACLDKQPCATENFAKMGGLDEEFEIAYEDVDFAHRLKKLVFDLNY